MIEAAPIELQACSEHLLALEHEIVGYVPHRDGDAVWGLWLVRRANPPLLVATEFFAVAFKFDVLGLSIQTGEQALNRAKENARRLQAMVDEWRRLGAAYPPPAPLPTSLAPPEPTVAWPFDRWSVDVLKRREWIVGPDAAPDDFFANGGPHLAPGETPPGTEHACTAATGLLFADSGRRLLIAARDMTEAPLVTQDQDLIERYVADCFAIPVRDYVRQLDL